MPTYTSAHLILYNDLNTVGTDLARVEVYSNTSDGVGDWDVGENTSGFAASPSTFAGFTDLGAGGDLYPVLLNSGGQYLVLVNVTPPPAIPATLPLTTMSFTACFGEGTDIATATGSTKVEDLSIGDHVRTAGGKDVPVLWVGEQKVLTVAAGNKTAAVRIKAGALGNGLPEQDLVVTGDHGIDIEGMIINASTLVNRDTIDFVRQDDLNDIETYYHIELENHDVVIANGAQAESYLNVPGRAMFDNFQEYLDLYGVERLIPEMKASRIATRRLLPEHICQRLGLSKTVVEDKALSA